MAAEKSQLRLAREAAGLSRRQVAEQLGTTEHRYWHCEMPPYDGPPEVLQAACQLFGLAPTTQGDLTRADREPPRGDLAWVCPRCGHREVHPASVSEVYHRCPRKNKELTQFKREVVRNA